MRAAGVPAEAVRVAHADRVDLPQLALLPGERVRARDAVLAVDAVPAVRVDAQDLALRQPQVLRNRGDVADAAVARGDVEQAEVLVPPVRRRVEADLLEPVQELGEPDAQDLAAGAGEDVGGRIRRGPLGDHAVHLHVRGRGQVRLLGRQRGPGLGVHGVELAVVPEVRVERREPEPAAEAFVVVEVGPDRGAQVEEDVLRAVVQQVELAVHVRHEQAAGAVGYLAEVVDPVVAAQSRVGRRRNRFRLRQLRDLGQLQAEARRAGRGQRVGDRRIRLGRRRGHEQR